MSSPDDAPVVPESQEARHASALDGVRAVATGMTLFYVVTISFELPEWSDPVARAVTLHDLAVFGVLAVLSLALWRRLIPPRWADLVSCGIATVVSFNVFATVVLQGSPNYLIFLPILLTGMGLFMVSGRLMIFMMGLVAIAWTVVAPQVATGEELPVHGYTLLVGAILAAAIFAARARTRARIDKLLGADARTKAALQQALVAAERELVDRKRAEEARRALEEQLAHSQRLEAIGSLAGGVAHDINNVLGGISAFASLVRGNDALDSTTATDIEEILAACRRGQALTQNLLAFARKGEHRKERFCPNHTVVEVERLLTRTIPKMIVVETHLEEGIADVEGDPGQLCQAVMNLCINSVDAMQQGGRLVITTGDAAGVALEGQRPGAPVERAVRIRVRDTGTGMGEETRQHAFDPFYTTKGTGEGTGLGLSMVYGTVTRLGGTVKIDSEPGAGTSITILLPGCDRAVAAEASLDETEVPPPVHGETVLVVDDELPIRRASKRILERQGYQVLLADNGAAALELFATRWSSISLVVLDMSMPVLGGRDCFHKLREIDPKARVLISTGYASGSGAHELLRAGAVGKLSKPFDLEQLSTAVAQAIATKSGGIAA